MKIWTISEYPSGHRLQERNSIYGMGVDRRIVSAKLEGQWTPRGTGDAWRRYKAARRKQDQAAKQPPTA
jgi:hypothetical protein